MKNIILLTTIMFLGACATTPTVKSAATPTVKSAATPTMKSVAGTYERKDGDSDHNRRVFLDNGVAEYYVNDVKQKDDRWKITKNGELHIERVGWVSVFSINKNGSLTTIATIVDGKRKDVRSRPNIYNRIK